MIYDHKLNIVVVFNQTWDREDSICTRFYHHRCRSSLSWSVISKPVKTAFMRTYKGFKFKKQSRINGIEQKKKWNAQNMMISFDCNWNLKRKRNILISFKNNLSGKRKNVWILNKLQKWIQSCSEWFWRHCKVLLHNRYIIILHNFMAAKSHLRIKKYADDSIFVR